MTEAASTARCVRRGADGKGAGSRHLAGGLLYPAQGFDSQTLRRALISRPQPVRGARTPPASDRDAERVVDQRAGLPISHW